MKIKNNALNHRYIDAQDEVEGIHPVIYKSMTLSLAGVKLLQYVLSKYRFKIEQN